MLVLQTAVILVAARLIGFLFRCIGQSQVIGEMAHDVEMGGRHVHHLVWGILLLLVTGYGWLLEPAQARAVRELG